MKKNDCFRLILAMVALVPASATHAQEGPAAEWVDISKTRLSKNISKQTGAFFLDRHKSVGNLDLAASDFSLRPPNKRVSKEQVSRKLLLRMRLFNSGDTASSVYFFPGLYYREIELFRVVNGKGLQKLPPVLPPIADAMGYRAISLLPGDSATIIAELVFLKTYINTVRPRLIEPSYISSFVAAQSELHAESQLMTYLFCGLLLMMILFSIASFLQGGNREFLYYSGYAFFIGIMLFTKAIYTVRTTGASYFLEEYLDFIFQSIGIIFYMAFMNKYLDTRRQYPFLRKLYNTGIAMLIVSMLSYSYFHYFTNNYSLELGIENSTKVLLLVMTVIFVVYSFRHWKDKLLRYLFWGNLCLFVFSLASQAIIMSASFARNLPGVFKSALFYYELGLFLELVFFLMALNHKNNRQLIAQARERERLKAENQMKEYEKELAVFKAQKEERERISADIHDELGSGMTAIRLMSEIARNKMRENVPVEIDKISHSADEVLNKMNAIIWSMNSGNDTLDNLVSYIRAYSLEYFENTPITCLVETPQNIEYRELTGDKRRNLFLCIKETLNNAMKHSHATQVKIGFKIDGALSITISDNGIGIDLDNIRQFGNGLNNISRRMESIGGTYEIEKNQGTITRLRLPL